MNALLLRGTVAATILLAAGLASAHDAEGPGGRLGTVHFKVSCNAAAQREFDLAMAYFHSFAWDQIKAPLDRTLQADPACGCPGSSTAARRQR